MATLFVTEFSQYFLIDGTPRQPQIPFEMPFEPAITTDVVSFTTATQGSAFDSKTSFVRLVSDADCHILFSSSPTATTSHQPFRADVEYFRGVVAGEKLSVVTA